MKKEEKAKMIKMLESLDFINRNAYFISGKLEMAYTTVHQNLSILATQGLLTTRQVGKRLYFIATEPGIEWANNVVSTEDEEDDL